MQTTTPTTSTGRSVNLAEVKVVHFIRHGEAEHNVAARLHGRQEYRKWEFLDAPLTEKGREQAREARTVLLPHMKPQVVLVSPLTRTLQTAEEIFQPRPDEEKQPRFEVWESVRERIGQNPCDKRRKVSEIRPQFPLFSFDRVQDDDHHLWGDVRESTEALLQRARTFLHALRQRPETCIGVVSHSAFLTALFVVLTTEEGLKNNGSSGAPDLTAASSPDAVASPPPVPADGHIDGDLGQVKTVKEKVYFTNGEVKSIVILPPP